MVSYFVSGQARVRAFLAAELESMQADRSRSRRAIMEAARLAISAAKRQFGDAAVQEFLSQETYTGRYNPAILQVESHRRGRHPRTIRRYD